MNAASQGAEPKPLPSPRIVLVEPQIPPNTGNVARLCAATGCRLTLVGKLGFELDDRHLKRAGLDYWDHVAWEHEPDREAFFHALPPARFHMLSTHAEAPYTQIPVQDGDFLLFGKETSGLPAEWRAAHPARCFTIPMWQPGVRSLNLSSAVAIVVYDALRRLRAF